ncbi:hypothetical protein JXA84_09635 [candidate division WOR-3 bacterium]|nr:hypothetical protein [candidate division WOR-3 bacterium]
MFFVSSGKGRRFFLLSVLTLVSCSTARQYDFSVYGGDNFHSPYRSEIFDLGLFEKSDELFFDIKTPCAGIFSLEENFVCFGNTGEVLSIDLEKCKIIDRGRIGGQISSVIESGGFFYAVADSFWLVKLDPDFKEVWRKGLVCPIISHLVIYKDFLVVFCEKGIYKITVSNGEISAVYEGADFRGSGRIAPLVFDGKIFAPGAEGKLVCLDFEDLEFLWSYFTGNFFPIRSVPVVFRSKPAFLDCEGSFHILDPETGFLDGKLSMPRISSPCFVAVKENKIVVSSLFEGEKNCFLFDAKEGRLSWQREDLYGKPLLFENAIVLAGDSFLSVVDYNGETMRIFTDSSVMSDFFVFSGVLTFFSENGLRIFGK